MAARYSLVLGLALTLASAWADDLDLPMTRDGANVVVPKVQAPPPPPPPPPAAPDPLLAFYGQQVKAPGGSVVFVIDRSASMAWEWGSYTDANGDAAKGGRLDRAKAQLTLCIRALPKTFKFDCLAFECTYLQLWDSEELADDAHKSEALAWVAALQPAGNTGTGPAVCRGLDLDAQNRLVIVLTDGAPNCEAGDGTGDAECLKAHLDEIRQNNVRRVTINVFGIGAVGEFRQFCIDLAGQNGGSYTDVR